MMLPSSRAPWCRAVLTVPAVAPHRYGVFSKMQRKGAPLEQVYDVRALRIIVKSKEDCYAALREVEKLWTPIEGRTKVRAVGCSLRAARHRGGARLPALPNLALQAIGNLPVQLSRELGRELRFRTSWERTRRSASRVARPPLQQHHLRTQAEAGG